MGEPLAAYDAALALLPSTPTRSWFGHHPFALAAERRCARRLLIDRGQGLGQGSMAGFGLLQIGNNPAARGTPTVRGRDVNAACSACPS